MVECAGSNPVAGTTDRRDCYRGSVVGISAEKMSISLDVEPATAVRSAAAEQGSSVSVWLADAAAAQIRRPNRQIALDAVAAEPGSDPHSFRGPGPAMIDVSAQGAVCGAVVCAQALILRRGMCRSY
jgi:hypothetical protein